MKPRPTIAAVLLICQASFATCLLAAPACCSGASLWSDKSRSLIVDRRAAAPGDIVTILIVQRSTTSHRASHSADKSLEVSGGPGVGLLQFFPLLSMETERSSSGAGATSEATSLVDRLSGVIVAVTPEGNLEVEATRHLKLNADELTLTLTGLVRPDDISPENTILSTQIADCNIASSGRGPIPGKQRPGLISGLLSLLW